MHPCFTSLYILIFGCFALPLPGCMRVNKQYTGCVTLQVQPRTHAEQAPSVQLLQPSSAVLGLFRAMHAPRHMAHFYLLCMLTALGQCKQLLSSLYLVLGGCWLPQRRTWGRLAIK